MSGRFMPGSPECREMFERLSEYIDGEMEGEQIKTFDDHMGDCAPCVAFVESLRRTVALIRRTPGAVLSEEQKNEILKAYTRHKNQGKT